MAFRRVWAVIILTIINLAIGVLLVKSSYMEVKRHYIVTQFAYKKFPAQQHQLPLAQYITSATAIRQFA